MIVDRQMAYLSRLIHPLVKTHRQLLLAKTRTEFVIMNVLWIFINTSPRNTSAIVRWNLRKVCQNSLLNQVKRMLLNKMVFVGKFNFQVGLFKLETFTFKLP